LFRHELNCAISLVSSIFLIFSQNLFFTIWTIWFLKIVLISLRAAI
jgi:hypothetical protein